jgi:hypothetical protein
MDLNESQSFRTAANRFARKHHTLSILLAGLLPVLLRLSLLPYLPIPEPEIHDEFSYLLGADTLASGRLTNPPHPLWVHFETFHVNQQPTYASKYPPGQSLFLALGQKFLGHPWYGVVLSVGLMCACICWMLQGWLPPSYALMGALFATAQYGATSYWMNSYWGGAVAATGGALVLGALPRFARRPGALPSALGAVGMILLALSRPYEGLIVTATSAAVTIWLARREGHSLRLVLSPRAVIPAFLILAGALAWMAYYNYRVAGDPWMMPYVVHARTYAATPHFWLLPEGAQPTYRHEVIRKLWAEWDHDYYVDARTHPFRLAPQLALVLLYPLSTPFRLSILVAVVLARSHRVRVALIISAVLVLGLLMEKAVAPHYFAPAAPLVIFLIVTGWRYALRMARARSGALRNITAFLLTGSFLYSLVYDITSSIRHPAEHKFASQRRGVVARLMEQGSRHVVIVRYSPDHNIHTEWVQNRADIDAAPIVWARDMGKDGNRELLEYYPDRKAWLLEPDAAPLRLTDISATPAKGRP